LINVIQWKGIPIYFPTNLLTTESRFYYQARSNQIYFPAIEKPSRVSFSVFSWVSPPRQLL
jgi:hypothetical protein